MGAPRATSELGSPVVVVGALAVVVALRWAAIVSGGLDGIEIGLLFGLGLLGVGLAGGRLTAARGEAPARPVRTSAPAVATDVVAGLAGGLALVAIALVARVASPGATTTQAGLGPAALFGPWVVVTTLVALAEELVLRGVLFTVLDRLGGAVLAVAVTSVAFALMHVPVYGWHVVPLDLGVGVFLGGLRLATGRWRAPGIAHVVADLATWWL